MKLRFTIPFAVAASLMVMAACTKSDRLPEEDSVLELSDVRTQVAIPAKSVIEGSSMTSDQASKGLGLFVTAMNGGKYDDADEGYSNVKLEYVDDTWTCASKIILTSTEGKLYAYYPYTSGNADLKQIPVSSSVDGDDFLYATSQTVSNKACKKLALSMNHALARVDVTLKLDASYGGSKQLSGIKFSGDLIAQSGKMDASDGAISATTGDVTLDFTSETISDPVTKKCLVVTTNTTSYRQDLKVSFKLGGEYLDITVPDVLVKPGVLSLLSFTVKSTGITLDSVGIGVWDSDEGKEITVSGHKVTVKLASTELSDKLFLSSTVSGKNVLIKGVPKCGRLTCTLGDNIVIPHGTEGNFQTFLIENVEKDTVATIGIECSVSFTIYGKGTISPSSEYVQYGSSVDFTRTPSSGWTFVKWLKPDGTESTAEILTLTVEDDIRLAAFFTTNYSLNGYFTVSDNGHTVCFSSGNLWADASHSPVEWSFENDQKSTNMSTRTSDTDSHISRFFWDKDAAAALKVNDSDCDPASPVLFTNASENTPNPDFTVGGSKGQWRVLSKDEWKYLLNERNMKNTGIPRYSFNKNGFNIESTICAGIFIYPDDYDGQLADKLTFSQINAAGIVYLPCTEKDNDKVTFGRYLSGTPVDDMAYNMRIHRYKIEGIYFGSIKPAELSNKSDACAIRLVTDSSK